MLSSSRVGQHGEGAVGHSLDLPSGRSGDSLPRPEVHSCPRQNPEADPSHEKQYSENGHNWPRVQPCFLVKAYIYKTVNLFFWPGVPGDVIFGPLNISFSDF